MTTVGTLAPLVQDFFAQHLLGYKRSSPQTIAAYRDTFRLLLAFLKQLRGREPSQLQLDDVDATAVLAFLDYLETDRKNSIRSRNARLAAVRSSSVSWRFGNQLTSPWSARYSPSPSSVKTSAWWVT